LLNDFSYIYKILNKVNGKFYIGSTNNFENRKSSHISKLVRGIHDNQHLQNAWNKYSEDNFDFIILERVPRKDQFKIEQKYLNELKPFKDNGYNIALDAHSGFNHERTKICVFCKQEFKTYAPNQKYCDECRNWQDDQYKQLETDGIIELVGGVYKFV
jgi:group I intron endonuclease